MQSKIIMPSGKELWLRIYSSYDVIFIIGIEFINILISRQFVFK